MVAACLEAAWATVNAAQAAAPVALSCRPTNNPTLGNVAVHSNSQTTCLSCPATEDLRRLLKATVLPRRRVANMGSVVRRKTLSGPEDEAAALPGGPLPPVAVAPPPGSVAGTSTAGGSITPRSASGVQFTPGNTPGAPNSLGACGGAGQGWGDGIGGNAAWCCLCWRCWQRKKLAKAQAPAAPPRSWQYVMHCRPGSTHQRCGSEHA